MSEFFYYYNMVDIFFSCYWGWGRFQKQLFKPNFMSQWWLISPLHHNCNYHNPLVWLKAVQTCTVFKVMQNYTRSDSFSCHQINGNWLLIQYWRMTCLNFIFIFYLIATFYFPYAFCSPGTKGLHLWIESLSIINILAVSPTNLFNV